MEEWKIRAERGRCEKPRCPLPSAKSFFAVLQLPQCTRLDLCDPCFAEHEQGTDKPPIFWRARRKTGSKEVVLDLESLRVLFDRLGAEPDPHAQELRYLVALLLLRKKVLKLVDPAAASSDLDAEMESADIVVFDPKQPEMAPVALRGPELDDQRLAALKQDLLAAL
jgi:hypothetical protein